MNYKMPYPKLGFDFLMALIEPLECGHNYIYSIVDDLAEFEDQISIAADAR